MSSIPGCFSNHFRLFYCL